MKTFCGIDIGLKGGLAIIDENSKILRLVPLTTIKNQQGKEEIDSDHLYTATTFYNDVERDYTTATLTVIEALKSFGNEGRASLWSFGTSNGKVRAILEVQGASFIAIDPKIWKDKLLKGTKKDKASCIGWCLQKFPGVDLKNGSTQYKDGLADALALAEFGRMQFIGGEKDGT